MAAIETLVDVFALSREELMGRIGEVPDWCCKLIAAQYPDARVRREALKKLGVMFVDDSSFVNAGFQFTPNSLSDVHVRIGRNVSIAPNVTCLCDSCANNGIEINSFRYVTERLTQRGDICICDDAWIGAGAILLPGVTVGRCAVVGAGCVLTRDADSYGIYAGVPGRKIGDIRQREEGFAECSGA